MMQALIERLAQLKHPQAPLIVGISGIDGSGKTRFTTQLADELRRLRWDVVIVHVDDFHHPRVTRQACMAAPPECYFRQTFDWTPLFRLLSQMREERSLDLELTLLDLASDRYEVQRHYQVTPASVVLVEGVFLFQPHLAPLFDLKLLLHISEEECLHRVMQRDGALFGEPEQIRQRYLTKYLPGQALYEQECHPEQVADWIIDNHDPLHPIVIRS